MYGGVNVTIPVSDPLSGWQFNGVTVRHDCQTSTALRDLLDNARAKGSRAESRLFQIVGFKTTHLIGSLYFIIRSITTL